MAHTAHPRTSSAIARIAALTLLLVIATVAAHRLGWLDYRDAVRHMDRIQRSHSVIGFTIAFVAIYGFGTAIGFPALPFTVAGGVLFGAELGSVLSWTAALIGAVVGYWLARTVGHDIVVRWLTRSPRASGAVARARDFGGLLRLRLIPVLPLGTVNVVGGLARAPFAPYLAATAVGVIPSTLVYTYFADALLDGFGSGQRSALVTMTLASALLIAISLVPNWLARRQARRSPELLIAGRSARAD